MEQVTFTKIHDTVINCLEADIYKTKLKSIGQWYHLFLESKEKNKLYLIIPFYEEEFSEQSLSYLRLYTFLYNLLNNLVICTSFEDKCLFNIFDYKETNNESISNLLLTFKKKEKYAVLWDKGTITPTKGFLPVFNQDNIVQFNDKDIIASTFKLFKAIKQQQLITDPVELNFDEVFIAFNNTKQQCLKSIINENLFEVERNLNDDDVEEIEDYLLEKKLKHSIKIKYPYSASPHAWISNVADKNFQLSFKNRFAYQDIEKDNVFLLSKELLGERVKFNTPEIEVVTTNHSQYLYQLMKQFREEWANLELNKFNFPFPKYWFLFINKQLKPDQWLSLFKTYYPAVENKPIITTFKNIVDELVALDWTTCLPNKSYNFIFPELTNNRLKKIDEIFRIFKTGLKDNIKFNNAVGTEYYIHDYFLDGYNQIDVANKVQDNMYDSVKIIMPDFLFFSVNPYLRYSLFKYVYTPLITNDDRSILDKDNVFFTASYIEEYNKEKNLLYKEAKQAINIYNNQYSTESIDEEPDEKGVDEFLYFTNEEEVDNHSVKYNKRQEKIDSGQVSSTIIDHKKIRIKTTTGDFFDLYENDQVLIEKNSIIEIGACQLKKGDTFICLQELQESLKEKNNKSINIDKLTKVPENVKNYKSDLALKNNVFKNLKFLGVSYSKEKYFNEHYIESDQFNLPLRKSDWKIICDYLNISEINRDMTFIAWYGRKKMNIIKSIYTDILHLLIDNSLLGQMESATCINEAVVLLESNHNEYLEELKLKIEDFNIQDFSKTILSNIIQQLTFNQVKSITIV
jgi:hypothetical protein